jgi:hypothetical protein
MEQNNLERIFKDGVLVRVHVGGWSGERELNPGDLGLKADDVVEAFTLGKKSLFPDEITAAFKRIENKGRNTVKRCSFNFGMDDFVPKTKFAEVQTTLKDLKEQYNALADEICEPTRYEAIKQQMTPIYKEAAEKAFEKLNPATIEFGVVEDPEQLRINREEEKAEFVGRFLESTIAQYPNPTSLRAKFYFTWSVFKTALPEMELADGDDIVAQEAAREEAIRQRNEQLGKFVGDVVASLRKETVDVCGRVAKAIREGKVIRSTSIDSIKNFIDRFKSMNFVGDQTVEEQLTALQRDFLTVDSSTYVEDVDLKIELGKRLEQVSQAASALTEQDINGVTSQYVRVVNWR